MKTVPNSWKSWHWIWELRSGCGSVRQKKHINKSKTFTTYWIRVQKVLEGMWTSVAQLVVRGTFNAWIVGSIPGTTRTKTHFACIAVSHIGQKSLRLYYVEWGLGRWTLLQNIPKQLNVMKCTVIAEQWRWCGSVRYQKINKFKSARQIRTVSF